jgi:hypothetical protein
MCTVIRHGVGVAVLISDVSPHHRRSADRDMAGK